MRIPDLRLFKNPLNETDPANESVINVESFLRDNPALKAEKYDFDFIADPDELVKTIKKVEKYVRNSYEYKEYVKYIRDSLNLNACFFFNNAKLMPHSKFHVEIHHGPFSLFDITGVIFKKHMLKYGASKIDFFKIANEVLKCHFDLIVGLVPLSTTAHELVHDGSLFIPLDYYFGDYQEFITKYKKWIPTELINNLQLQQELTKAWYEENKNEQTPFVLQRGFTYLESNSFELPETL